VETGWLGKHEVKKNGIEMVKSKIVNFFMALV
jgi:hypothetical protein